MPRIRQASDGSMRHHLPSFATLQSVKGELLHQALSGACAQSDRYERIYVTCINEASYRIARRIVQDLPHQKRTAWRMYMQI